MSMLANYEGAIEKSIHIERPAVEIYQALFNYKKWIEYLPHVQHIETLYEDDMYQEFIMHVASDNGLLKVRSARRCNQIDEIRYFQPEPPKFLKHHAGVWKIKYIEENITELIAYHFWNVKEDEAKKYFRDEESTINKQVANFLGGHALFAMTRWKTVLESGDYK